MSDKVDIELLENLEKTLYADHWKEDTMLAIVKYKAENEIDDNGSTDIFLNLLKHEYLLYNKKKWLPDFLERIYLDKK